MTNQTVQSQPVSLHILRDAVDQAERNVDRLNETNIVEYLLLLDQIEQMLPAFEDEKDAIRSEQARWEAVHNRITTNPELIVAPAAKVGGLAKLRSQHAPATGYWWHLDTVVSGQRRQTLQRSGIIIGAIVVVVALVWGGITFFASRNVEALSLSDVTTNIEQLVRDQKWSEALDTVTTARETLPDDAELMVWESVLSEQTKATRAPTLLREAQAKLSGDPTRFWLLVGNDRLQVGNLTGAEEAAQEALAASPQDAQVTFLLGSIAEASGDISLAADYFNQTVELAGEDNVQLGVIAKVRLGNLTPNLEPLPGAGITETTTLTETQPVTP